MISGIFCANQENAFSWKDLKPFFEEKCRIRGVQPDRTYLTSETLREWNESAWIDRLGPMLKDVQDFDRVWKEWVKTFRALVGE